VGIATALSYSFPRPDALQRSVRVVTSSRGGAWIVARLAPVLDRAVARLTRGRTTASAALSGLPVIVVTTTGRRSGMPRQAQLIGIPVDDDGLALLGTNFGQATTPTWALNLEADPRATVAHGAVSLEVVARPATDEERAEVLASAAALYVGYSRYASRITGRRVRIFVLDRAPDVA
jgi:deazaflavin-dependent oxidoreductase (nitroreductase family)